MGNEFKEIGIGLSHIPTIQSGKYTINAFLENGLNNGNPQHTTFYVAGYHDMIPQNEVLTVYPISEGIGNYAGVFPHIQFKRSTLPWEYVHKFNEERVPYLFLVLVKETEFQQKRVEIIESDTDHLTDALESEKKTITILKFEPGSEIPPPLSLLSALAHVRVQQHTEIALLNLPEETSILTAHRMVEPDTRYRVFVCSYVEINDHSKMVSVTEDRTSTCLVLHEWSFESIGKELYQIDTKKLRNHPNFKDFEGIEDAGISDYEDLKSRLETHKENPSYLALLRLVNDNEKFLKAKEARFNSFKQKLKDENPFDLSTEEGKEGQAKIKKENDTARHLFEENEKIAEKQNNHILEYLEYNGKTLKGLLHELGLQPFKTNLFTKNEAANRLFNVAKVPLAHHLKGGGKMISWYQGPFASRNYFFDLEGFQKEKDSGGAADHDLPDHADHLILFNDDTKMYDMTYASAWQLGRLMIMNDNKVLQELKKWKYDLALNQLIEEQNNTTHLVQLSTDNSVDQMPALLSHYVAGFLKFENFPLYYLFPHADFSTEESCKYFKIDRSWLLAFLFGIFSTGSRLKTSVFKNLVLGNAVIRDVFSYETECYGIVLQSQIIKNWPHLVVELNKDFNFKFVTTINSSLRLYVTDRHFDEIQLYLKSENAHFAVEYPKTPHTNEYISKIEDGYTINGRIILQGKLPFELLYKQPYVQFKITKTSDL